MIGQARLRESARRKSFQNDLRRLGTVKSSGEKI